MFNFNEKKNIKSRIEDHLRDITETMKMYDSCRQILDSTTETSETKRYAKFEKDMLDGKIRHSILEIKYEMEKL